LTPTLASVGAFSSVDIRVDCPAGKPAVGGGAASSPNVGEIQQPAPTDVSGLSWTASVHHSTGALIPRRRWSCA
jgi:hypothetical protein